MAITIAIHNTVFSEVVCNAGPHSVLVIIVGCTEKIDPMCSISLFIWEYTALELYGAVVNDCYRKRSIGEIIKLINRSWEMHA